MSRKRGQNEGSVYKRKDGRWVGQVTVQSRPISKYFKTAREAREWVKVYRDQVEAGLTLDGAKMTISAFFEIWLGAMQTSLRPKTLIQYRQIVRQHILPTFGNMKLKDLRPDQIQSFYTSKLEKGTSARTVLLIHAVLHKSLNYALKTGLTIRNPADAVNRPKIRRKEMVTLTDSQARALISAVDGTRDAALYYLAVSTGLRKGELLGLKWSDLDWKTRRLKIQRQTQSIPGQGQQFTEPKTAAGRRVVVLGEKAIEILRKHQGIQNMERKFADDRWQEYDLIFPSTIGTPMEGTNLYHRYKLILQKCGLPNIRFHDLRHTAATLMLQQGTNPKIVQERLGHSDISLTLNTYSHVLPDMQEEVASKLDDLLMPLDVTDELNKIKEVNVLYEGKTAKNA